MEEIAATVFDTEEASYKGAEEIRDLHRNGELAVYAAGVISKDAEGQVLVTFAADEAPIGTAFGLSLGTVVGVLAGPVPSPRVPLWQAAPLRQQRQLAVWPPEA